MGNSVPGVFGFRAARPGRAEAMKFFRPAIDDPEVDVGEADPVAAVGLGDADGFALQRFADEDQVAALDGAVGRTRRMACQASYQGSSRRSG